MTTTAAAPAVDVTPPPAKPLALGFFDPPGPARLIVGMFAVVTLPLAAVTALRPSGELLWVYLWLFGMTHFVLTLTVYLQWQNLRHFAGTWRRRALFFGLPVGIFVLFDALHAGRVGMSFPVFAVWFWGAVRLLDFNHFNRQSFGVLQLFKARCRVKFSPGLKQGEDLFFGSLTLLLFVTFLSGGLAPVLQAGGPLSLWDGTGIIPPVLPTAAAQWAFLGLSVIAVSLGGWCVAGLVRQWRAAGRPAGLGLALGYFGVQAAASLIATVSFPLYVAALAVHYVEYHVLMYPRCFHSRLDATARVDRVFGKLRESRVVFYAAVVAAAGVVTLCAAAGMGSMGRHPGVFTEPRGYLVLIAAFDGLFVFHYVVEMFIWRFADPHFRQQLSGLYFAPKPVG
jgi:hypothetical protein